MDHCENRRKEAFSSPPSSNSAWPVDQRLQIVDSYYASGRAVLAPLLATILLSLLWCSLFVLLFGVWIFKPLKLYFIVSIICLVILFGFYPQICHTLKNWANQKNYDYLLYITQDYLLCAKAPYGYQEKVNVDRIRKLCGDKVFSVEQLSRAFEEATREAKKQTEENLLSGTLTYCLSRHFSVFSTGSHIKVMDGQTQLILPFNRGALTFLTDVAQFSDSSTKDKVEESRSPRIYHRELCALLIGIAFGYAFQLFGFALAYLGGGDFIFTLSEVFYPNLAIMGIPALFGTWLAFAYVRVRWMRLWKQISLLTYFGFGFPFCMICAGALFLQPALFHQATFYFTALVCSLTFLFVVGIPVSRKIA